MKSRITAILLVLMLMMSDSVVALAESERVAISGDMSGEKIENINLENADGEDINFAKVDTEEDRLDLLYNAERNNDSPEEGNDIEQGDKQSSERFYDVPDEDYNDLDSDEGLHAAEQKPMLNHDYVVWNGTVGKAFCGGSGTASDPYLISSGLELSYFQQTVNSGNSYEGKYVALSADIYLNEIADYDSWSDTNGPANLWTGISGFAGNFDGRSHTIYGLYMCGADNTGFFCEINNDTETVIKNLNFENAYVYGGSCVGVIAGKANHINIDHCSVSGRVIGINDIGGLVGDSSEGSKISNNINYASIVDEQCVGGIIGNYSNYYQLISSTYRGSRGTINNCINKGVIFGSGDSVGGIAGLVSYNVNGLDCIRLGNENSVESTGYSVGGIFGEYSATAFGSETSKKFEQCYNLADISGEGNIGGIIGFIEINENRIAFQDIYNAGRISSSGSAGGIVGHIRSSGRSKFYVKRSHNVGSVKNTENTARAIIGTTQSVVTGGGVYASNSYYLSGTASASQEGFSAEQLKKAENFVQFDFQNVWKMGIKYPVFLWQEEVSDEYFVGTLTIPVQTDTGGKVYIGIDNKLYEVDEGVDIGKCADITLNSKGGIVYSMFNGRVSDIYASKDIMSITTKVTTEPQKIIYQNGKLNTYNFKLNVKVYNLLNGEYDFLPTKVKSQLKEYLTNIKIDAGGDSDLNFGKDGFWIFANDVTQINENLCQEIGCGGSISYSYQVNINNKYSINTANAFLGLDITATTEFETVTSTAYISIGNLDYQTQQAETKKGKASYGKAGKSANVSVKKHATRDVVLDSYLNNYLESQQIQICEEYIYAYVGTLMASTSSEFSISDQVMDKVFDKLGINKSLLTSVHTLVGTTKIQFGNVEVEIKVDMGSYNLGTSNSYAASGKISYKVYKNNTFIQSGTGAITYTDVTTFVNDLKNIAESYIKSGYKKIWGNNADKIANYLTEGTIVETLRNEGIIGNFSDDMFKVLSVPTKRYTEVCIECPVDVQVYDLNGTLCGAISANTIDTSYHDVYIRVEEDKKYVYLCGDDYYLKLIGNDTGTMDYYVNEYNSDQSLARAISYNEVPLNDETTYYATIPDAGGYSPEIYELVDSSGNTFNPPGSKLQAGDINNDGSVDVFDLMMCLNHVVGKKKLEGNAFDAADVVKDDIVNLFDLMKILNHIAGGSAL